MGTMLPFVQGTSSTTQRLLSPVTALAVAFAATSAFTFGLLAWLGDAVITRSTLSLVTYLGVGLVVGLSLDELRRFRRRTYCAIGWRRQTPERLKTIDAPGVVAVLWGVDTGTGFSTFKMTNGWWILASLVLVGAVDPLPTGLAYGIGFGGALCSTVFGRGAESGEPADLQRHFPMVRGSVVVMELLVVALAVAWAL